MLKSVKFNNFKMFKNDTFIDLSASKSEILKEYNVFNNILRGCFFYGGNASGKTTALHAITILLDMMFKEYIFPNYNVCIFSKTKIAKFEYEFVIDDSNIKYSFSVNPNGEILKEFLFLDDVELVHRLGTQATTSLTLGSEEETKLVDSKILFLRIIRFNNGLSEYPILNKWMKFLENSIYIDNSISKQVTFNMNTLVETNLLSYLDKHGVEEVNEFFSYFGIPYSLEYNKIVLPGQTIPTLEYNNLVTNCKVPYQLESYGNKILLQLLPYILSIKNTGGMLLIDEFGGALHNQLSELIINYLFKNTQNTQIFIVTHETNLLKSTLVRPDQIYLVDYDQDGSKISKASKESPRESQNLEKMYLAGVFGGLPQYNN